MHNCGYPNCPGPETDARQHIKIRDPLSNFTRYRLYHLIRDNPGIGQREASMILEVCTSTVINHIQVLRDFELINVKRAGAHVGYYPVEMTMTPQEILATKLNENERDVLSTVQEKPGVSQREVVGTTGINQSTASQILKKLASIGKLTSQKLGRSVFYYPA